MDYEVNEDGMPMIKYPVRIIRIILLYIDINNLDNSTLILFHPLTIIYGKYYIVFYSLFVIHIIHVFCY